MQNNGKNRFFIVGAMRSGTTYLATILDEHPEISMAKPLIPEPKFFLKEEEYKKGMTFYQEKYFGKNKWEKVLGEKSIQYFEKEKAVQRIKQCFPKCKILIVLRYPVYSAISNYHYSVINGLETRTIEDVFLNNIPVPDYDLKMNISPFDYLRRGQYINFINMYENYFDKKNIKIILMEDFINNIKEIKKVYNFLGVDCDFIPDSLNIRINSNNENMSVINPDVNNILKEYYSEYNTLLKKRLGINVNHWK